MLEVLPKVARTKMAERNQLEICKNLSKKTEKEATSVIVKIHDKIGKYFLPSILKYR